MIIEGRKGRGVASNGVFIVSAHAAVPPSPAVSWELGRARAPQECPGVVDPRVYLTEGFLSLHFSNLIFKKIYLALVISLMSCHIFVTLFCIFIFEIIINIKYRNINKI